MSDDATPHGAALVLLRMIAWAEGKNLNTTGGNADAPTRAWILWTYAQCYQTVGYPQSVKEILDWPIPK
jgi:hypothetical protein